MRVSGRWLRHRGQLGGEFVMKGGGERQGA